MDEDERGRKLVLLMGGAILVSCFVGGYYFFKSEAPAEGYSKTGFDMSQVAERAPEPAGNYTVPVRAKPALSPAPVTGGLNLNMGQAPQPGNPKFQQGGGVDQAREREFLKANGGVISQYLGHMNRITMARWKASPVVRDVDRAFANMPRYMEIKSKADRGAMTPHQFVREAVALPEVRAEISGRMKDPAVWRESVLMILETLKNPPPAALYKEAQRFVTKDPSMVEYLPSFTGQATQNMGAALKGMPRDRDLTPLQKVMQDVAPNMAAGQTGSPASPGQPPRR